jgi:hypothetical protein
MKCQENPVLFSRKLPSLTETEIFLLMSQFGLGLTDFSIVTLFHKIL